MVCSRRRRTCSSLSVDSIRSPTARTCVWLLMMVLLMGCHKATTAFVPRTVSQALKAARSTTAFIIPVSISNTAVMTPTRQWSSWSRLLLASQSSSSSSRQQEEQRHNKDPTTTTSAASFSSSQNSGYGRPVVQWYPGHIAKAERQLQETMKAVDVVIEVRDARICKATAHPMVGAWCAGRPRLVVLTHVDQVPKAALKAWQRAYDALGAAHPDQAAALDGQILHQAQQAARERAKYDMPTVKKSSRTRTAAALSDAAVAPVQDVIHVNAKLGAGVPTLQRAIFKAGAYVQERRLRRGLKARPLRVGVIGYPNVGKSALINRLLGRKRARTANTPGVTRSLQWIRVRQTSGTDRADGSINSSSSTGKEFELLDSPGIIPATLVDQSDATLLAACNCIGEAAYDNQAVASYLCEWLLAVYRLGYGRGAAPTWRQQVHSRYGFDPLSDVPTTESILPNFDVDDDDAPLVRPRTGEDILYEVADRTCQGDPEDAARKILQDFRTGRLGNICLQIAPSSVDDKGQRAVLASPAEQDATAQREREAAWEAAQAIRAKEALEVAQARGIALPPVVEQAVSTEEDGEQNGGHGNVEAGEDGAKTSKREVRESEIGKGLFDGW